MPSPSVDNPSKLFSVVTKYLGGFLSHPRNYRQSSTLIDNKKFFLLLLLSMQYAVLFLNWGVGVGWGVAFGFCVWGFLCAGFFLRGGGH